MGVLQVHGQTGHRVQHPGADLTLVLAPVEPVVGRMHVVDLLVLVCKLVKSGKGFIERHIGDLENLLGHNYGLRVRTILELVLLQSLPVLALHVCIDAGAGPGHLLGTDLAEVVDDLDSLLAILPQVVLFLRGVRLLDVAPEAGGEGFVADVAGPLAPVVPGLPAAQRLRHFLQLRRHRQVWHRPKDRRAEAQAHVGGGCCHVKEVVRHGEAGAETWRSGAEPLRRTAEGSDV